MAPRPKQLEPGKVSALVAELRKAYGMTQQAFSNNLGVALNTVARWESIRVPDKDYLPKLADMAVAIGRNDIADILRIASLDEDGAIQMVVAFGRIEQLLGSARGKLFKLTTANQEFERQPLSPQQIRGVADEVWEDLSRALKIAKTRGVDSSNDAKS
jgi:transcriptional regulator with XRE-family HTH domain